MPEAVFQCLVSPPAARPERLSRSCLVVPGTSRRMIDKAARSGADQVVLDLEDSVPLDQKDAARQTVVGAVTEVDFGTSSVAVRVNASDSPHQLQDVLALGEVTSGLVASLVLPKIQSVGQVWFAEHLLEQLELRGAASRRIQIELQIETALAMCRLSTLAGVTDRTAALLFGPGDYAADLGVPSQAIGQADDRFRGHQWHHPLASIVTAARAIGRDAIDGPVGDYRDREAFLSSAWQSRLLGFDGKWCIHPDQVPLANDVFSPTEQEAAEARAILDALESAADCGTGSVGVAGSMVDEASARMARKVLMRHEARARSSNA